MDGTPHSYSCDPDQRTAGTARIAVAAVGLAFLIHSLIELSAWKMPFWLDLAGPVFLFGLLNLFVDKWWWRNKLVRFLLRIHIPDLNGQWLGEYQSSYEGKDSTGECELTVKQSWRSIQMFIDFEHSRSSSMCLAMHLEHVAGPQLKYIFRNDPKNTAPPDMKAHEGAVSLTYATGELQGEYYNDPSKRGRFGQLQFQKSIPPGPAPR